MSASDFDKLFAIHEGVQAELTRVTKERNDALRRELAFRTALLEMVDEGNRLAALIDKAVAVLAVLAEVRS